VRRLDALWSQDPAQQIGKAGTQQELQGVVLVRAVACGQGLLEARDMQQRATGQQHF
jgi:hypothetical protein